MPTRFRLEPLGGELVRREKGGAEHVSLLWIILIVVLVLLLLGFFTRGRW
jgi:flagellar basal body-associated protein FliL